METDRDVIVGRLAAAITALDEASARAYAADAVEDVTSHPGLRYAPLSADEMTYVVACDGRVIGCLWRGAAGVLLGGWTCATLDQAGRLGPFHTSRAAAAALAAACGVTPRHELA